MRCNDRLAWQRPRRRSYLHFEKVRVLFVPKHVFTVAERGEGGEVRFALRYGPRPEHLIRSYPTIEQANEKGRELAQKFNATFSPA